MSSSPRLKFIEGAIDTIPLMIGAIPFGIIYGTLSQSSDLSVYGALALSSIVFAGSSQFVALGLIASGSSIFIIIVTTFLINLRHLLYSFSLRQHLSHLPQKWKIPLSFGLTDETFAVTIKHYSYGKNNSFLLENNQVIKLNCKKKTPSNEVIALTNHKNPPELILNKLKEFGVTSFRKLSSSYKYCVIATGEYDLYVDKVRANEWDDAAGHAIAESAGAIVTSLDNKSFKYGKEDYKNPTILIRRSNNLNA